MRALIPYLVGVLSTFAVPLAAQPALPAHRPPSQAVIAAALSAVDSSLRLASDARVQGPIGFDPRILRAPRRRAPAHWADSVALTWTGFAWDSVRPPAQLAALLQAANGTCGPVRWLACGTAAGTPPCHTGAFPAVVSVSEPWVSGDHAQVLFAVAYRSSSPLHPHAWMANLLRLRRVDGEWVVARWHNRAGT